uniref:Uncharacterized protein n=1 Tax=Oncorhynchus tshawytscha TaxID=74940 RepID=A0A8C8GCV1_ONCTS
MRRLSGTKWQEAVKDLEQLTMAVLVIRKEEEGPKHPPEDIGVVIKGVKVVNELTSVASACAILLCLIYALDLSYPKTLHFTFEVFQKILVQLDQHKMSPKVQSLCCKLSKKSKRSKKNHCVYLF